MGLFKNAQAAQQQAAPAPAPVPSSTPPTVMPLRQQLVGHVEAGFGSQVAPPVYDAAAQAGIGRPAASAPVINALPEPAAPKRGRPPGVKNKVETTEVTKIEIDYKELAIALLEQIAARAGQ